MAVAFDAAGPSAAGTGNAASASLSWTHTAVASGVAILAGVSLDATADGALTMTATCDGVSPSFTPAKVHSNATTQGYLQVFGWTGLSSGAHTIAISVSGGTPGDLEGGSLSFSGAAGFGTPVTGTGSSTTPSVAVATNAIGSVLAGFIACGDAVTSATSPSTSRFIINEEGPNGFATGNAAGETAPGTGASVTMAWAISLAPYAIIAVEVKALIAPPPPPAILYAPGWFPGSQAVTVDPGGIPFYGQPPPTDEAPAVIFPPTPEADPVRPVPPGWFPGADQVTATPDGIPFAPLPGTTDAAPAVIYPVPDVVGEVQWLPWPPNYFPGSQSVSVDPGGIPFYAQPQPLTPPPAPAPLPFPFLRSTAGTGTGQYFTDQNGQPYLLRWDTVWNLIVNAGNSGGVTTWQSDMDGYCSARAAEGFNGFLTTPVATTAIPGAPFTNGNTWDGVAPFSAPGALNGAFWGRVDYLLNSARNNGLTVVLNVGYTYSVFNTGGPLNGWTNAQFQSYGAAVGARYSAAPNVVWEVGDDYGGSWDGGLNGFDAKFNAFLAGLRSTGATQMISVENMSEGSSRYSIDGATTYAWGVANASFDWIYSYDVAYTAIENAYTEAANHSVPSLCVCKMDGWYDNQYNGGTLTESVELFARKWIWWTLSSGSRGAMYGQNELYQWSANALSSGLAGPTPGSQYMQPAALNGAWNIFASFTGWHQLVPDTSSALVTAGRGTRSNGAFGTGAGTAGPTSMYLGGNTYVTASITASGSLAVIYNPAANTQTITVNGSLMVSGYTATWVDPASGAQTPTAISPTYSRSVANSAGDHDWLLVLQAPSAPAVPGAGLAVWQPQPPGWFPGADSVTDLPGGIPFYVVPQPTDQNAAVASTTTTTATATLAGAAAVAALVTEAPIATVTGAGALTALVVQDAGTSTSLAGAASVSALVTEIAGATVAGAGGVSDVATQAAAATLAGAGSITDVVTQIVTAALAGAGALTASAIGGSASANLAAAAALTALAVQAATAVLAGAGTVTATVTQAAKATAAGAGALSASGQITGTANLAGAGTVTALAVQAVTAAPAGAAAVTGLVVQPVTATAAGAGAVTAVGATQAAFTVGTLTGRTVPTGAVGTRAAPSSTITARTQRTGGSS